MFQIFIQIHEKPLCCQGFQIKVGNVQEVGAVLGEDIRIQPGDGIRPVMVHIRKLRVKIEKDPQNPKIIRTVWGKGYKFDVDSQ